MKLETSYALPVTIFREGEAFVAYTPALDLSSVGKTEEEAKKMFTEAVEAFFEDLSETKMLGAVLLDLGWTKTDGNFMPPKVVKHSLMSFRIPELA